MKTLPALQNSIILSINMALFLGVNVLRNFGYKINDESASAIQKLFPSFILMACVSFVQISLNKNQLSAKSLDIKFLLFSVILILYLITNNLTSNLAFIPNTIVLPILFSICIDSNNEQFLKKIKKIIIFFFIINCSVAILERYLTIHLFEIIIETTDYSGFRATAFQNHPLNNALITSVIMSFVLISNLNNAKKYTLFMLGFISIICYGSRSSIIGCTLMLFVHLIHDLLFSKYYPRQIGAKNMTTYCFIFFGIISTYFLITYTQFGERLMNTAYFDDSANVRLEAFNIFNSIKVEDLLWGFSFQRINKMQSAAGIHLLENFWIEWLLRFGIVLTALLIPLFIAFIWNKTSQHSSFKRMFVTIFFLGIASTNNSLASSTAVVSVFILCSYCFFSHRKVIKYKEMFCHSNKNLTKYSYN